MLNYLIYLSVVVGPAWAWGLEIPDLVCAAQWALDRQLSELGLLSSDIVITSYTVHGRRSRSSVLQ